MDTIEQINLELEATRATIAHRKKNTNTLDNLLIQQKECTEAKYAAAQVFVKEERDVKELERFTITSIFASLSGGKEERLEKEVREAAAAKIRYEMACRDLEDITQRITALHNEESDTQALEAKLEELLVQKSALLKAQKIASSAKLTALEEQIAKLRDNGHEIEEAQKAGSTVLGAIFSMESNLNSARSAGLLDMAGGGYRVYAVKANHMEMAQKDAETIQRALSHFRTELSDVTLDVSTPSIEVGNLLSIADILFDSIFVDMAVQKKITKALAGIAPIRPPVEQAIARLNALAEENNKKIDALVQQREIILNGHGEG